MNSQLGGQQNNFFGESPLQLQPANGEVNTIANIENNFGPPLTQSTPNLTHKACLNNSKPRKRTSEESGYHSVLFPSNRNSILSPETYAFSFDSGYHTSTFLSSFDDCYKLNYENTLWPKCLKEKETKVDFIKNLLPPKKNLRGIVHLIFSKLSLLELLKVKRVSTTWNNAVEVFLSREQCQGMKELKTNQENLFITKENGSRTSSGTVLKEISPNQATAFLSVKVAEPEKKVSMFDKFLKEASKTKPNVTIYKCPKCCSPSVPSSTAAHISVCKMCDTSFCSKCYLTVGVSKHTCKKFREDYESPVKMPRICDRKRLRRLFL